jgi:hypothetical protein
MFHVYSKYTSKNSNENARNYKAQESWTGNLKNVPVLDSFFTKNSQTELKDTSRAPVPFLKDVLDYAASLSNDDDLIIYTNSDIYCVTDIQSLIPSTPFFSVRKDIEAIPSSYLSSSDIDKIPFIKTVNVDLYGFTKKDYMGLRDKIPNFLIGVPYWDIALLFILKDNVQLTNVENISYHVKHDAVWKQDTDYQKNSILNKHNRKLFIDYIKPKQLDFLDKESIKGDKFLEYMSLNFNFKYN